MRKLLFGAMMVAVSTVSYAKVSEEFVANELIVKLKDSKRYHTNNRVLLNKENDKKLIAEDTYLVKVSTKTNLDYLIIQLNNDPSVEYAEKNYIYHAIGLKELQTNDPKFSNLWGLVNTGSNEPASSSGNSSRTGVQGVDINALNAWKINKGDKRIKIAVIDTGIDYNHEDLKSNIWTNTLEANGLPGVDDDNNGYIDDIHGYDFANSDGDPMDGNGHGTHCSGTIGAIHDNGVGVAGVMSEVQLIGIKFLTDQGSGTTANAIAAIDYAVKIGADIMSNSWGGGGYSKALEEAIERANRAGIIFTAAAGNNNTDNNTTPQYPANYDLENIISVAAYNYNDQLASFSCYGSNTVHVAGPGRNILSTTPNNKYEVYSGTSMATPHISGVIGLYLSEYGSTDPKALRDELMSTSVYNKSYGRKIISGGRVDAYNFLAKINTERPETPNPNEWQTQGVQIFETNHPYYNNVDTTRTFTVPGAKFVRVIIDNYDIERFYDVLKIFSASGDLIDSVDGVGQNFVSGYSEGDSITVNFKSDKSVNQWGFIISEVQFIK